ncbi:MAG: hypothetical protein IJ375_02220 [Oscillospiraceae bacterium]|nr:hypothetical protein [Oscillospiraceae bacterium]
MANYLNYSFKTWCLRAIAQIRFPPDQDAVMAELYAHMLDHYDALMEAGVGREEAERRTLEAMGSPEEIAPQLAAVHHPFWGWLLWGTRIALALILCAAVFCAVPYLRNTFYSGPDWNRYDPYEDTYISDEVGVTELVLRTEPDQSAESDGFHLTLTRAAWWHTDFVDDSQEDLDTFRFQIRVFNPRPWAGRPEFYEWLWAEDSLGNYYYPFYLDNAVAGDPGVTGNCYHSAPFTYTLDMWLSNFCSMDADWIDIHYDRSGRDIVLRIDLTGGDGA